MSPPATPASMTPNPNVSARIRADATLSPGDCIVDGEHGTVDGRLSTRLDEVRRILSHALAQTDGAAP